MSLLSKDKVAEIKGVLAQVNLTEICQRLEVKRRTVYGVLYGESSDYETLKKVVKEAKKVIREQKKTEQDLQSL